MAATKKRKKSLEERLDIEVPAIPKLDIDYGSAGGGGYTPAMIGPLDDALLPTMRPDGAPLPRNSYEERVQWMGYVLVTDIALARKRWKGKVDHVRLTIHRPYNQSSYEAYPDPNILPTIPELRKKYAVIDYKGREFVLIRCGSSDIHPDPWFVKRSEIS